MAKRYNAFERILHVIAIVGLRGLIIVALLALLPASRVIVAWRDPGQRIKREYDRLLRR